MTAVTLRQTFSGCAALAEGDLEHQVGAVHPRCGAPPPPTRHDPAAAVSPATRTPRPGAAPEARPRRPPAQPSFRPRPQPSVHARARGPSAWRSLALEVELNVD